MAATSLPVLDSNYFFETLARRHRGVLVIDFDSTIAHLGRADSVFPYPTVQELLDSIIAMTGTRVIVATARPLEELRSRFAPPGPEIRSVRAGLALESFADGSPLAFVSGEGGDAKAALARRLRVCPQYSLGGARRVAAPPEELAQFLMDWLRACTQEVC